MRYRVDLLGTLVDNVSMRMAIARIRSFIQSGTPHQVVTVNVDFLRLARRDALFRTVVNSADLVVADGMPLVWASRLRGDPLPQRLSGIELMHACAEMAVDAGYRIFLLGAGPGVAQEAAAVLEQRFPGIHVAGTYTPPLRDFSAEEDSAILAHIRAAAPHMLFVAFGAPKQEQWIRGHLHELSVPVCMGIGGTFDILAGRVSRAPLWMQRSGLEWAYRLWQEPHRLWKRYLIHDMPVFFRLMRQSGFARRLPFGPVPVALREGSVAENIARHAELDILPREEASVHSA